MTQKTVRFRIHLSDGTSTDIDGVSSAAARIAAQAKLNAEGSTALITKIKVLKTERA